MKTKIKTIFIPSMILAFFLMLMNVSTASAQQQAVSAEKAAAKKMENQMPTTPSSKPEANKSVTQSGKANSAMMQSTIKKPMVSNHEIKSVQESLNKDGYKLTVDGILGLHTSNAIKDFQKKNALKVTGRPDSETLAKLNLK